MTDATDTTDTTDTTENAIAAYHVRLQAIAAIADAPRLSSVEAGRALQQIAELCSRELRALDFSPRDVRVTFVKTGPGAKPEGMA